MQLTVQPFYQKLALSKAQIPNKSQKTKKDTPNNT